MGDYKELKGNKKENQEIGVGLGDYEELKGNLKSEEKSGNRCRVGDYEELSH